ncbi:MAG: SH3 domain-containing protein [Caldilineaceae bacterium]|nr:SH3 domain-containing protein [Caldilineaceae bacterium]
MMFNRKISMWPFITFAVAVALFLMFWKLSAAQGQEPVACTDVITELKKSLRKCDNLNNNSVCYGRKRAEALPFSEPFDRSGDRIPIAAAQKIATLSDTGTVIMYVSVGSSDPVTIITFGNTEIEPDAQSIAPNSFIASTVDQKLVCEQTPPGLIVYTESGQSGAVNINGIELTLHSAAYVILNSADSMTIVNLNGQVRLKANGQEFELPLYYGIEIQGLLTSPVFMEPAAPADAAQSEVARWLVDKPDGLHSVHNFNNTILSCSRDNVLLPFSEDLRLYSTGQECLIGFCAAAGDRITVRMEALDGQLDPWVDLRGPNQRLLRFNNNLGLRERNALLCGEPLPTEGCYTIVAHSRHHESQGRFRLRIEAGQTAACTDVPSICEVTYYAGLNLRRGPEDDSPAIRALLPDTEVEPLALSTLGTRLKVRVVATGEEGWVLNSPEALSCSGPLPAPTTPTPTPTGITSTPTPSNKTPKSPTPIKPTSTPTSTPIVPTSTPIPIIPQPSPTKQSPYD